MKIHLGLYRDETARACEWHIPETHYLEQWSDIRAFEGTASIVQPLIAPLYDGRSAHELLTAMMGLPDQSIYQLLRAYWQAQGSEQNFEQFWRVAVHDGVIPGTSYAPEMAPAAPGPAASGPQAAPPTQPRQAPPTRTPAGSVAPALPSPAEAARQQQVRQLLAPVQPEARPSAAAAGQAPARSSQPDGLEIIYRPDPSIWDGRYAFNAWLQELPKPFSTITWGNAVFISPAMAERLQVSSEAAVELEYGGTTVAAPVWVLPGHADNSVTVTFGYGRQGAGRVGEGLGYNAYSLRTMAQPWFALGAKIRPLPSRLPLAETQGHHRMEGRALVREGSIHQYREDPDFLYAGEEHHDAHASFYPEWHNPVYSWGMAIDLNKCVGCNACMVACQAENNIPVVGRDQVFVGREMHWIRVDTYYKGGYDNPGVFFQPVPCMHCETAPCEPVCPVAATVHSEEGLNQMVYNRCVGTRYCSNNCPYKVRRFNFLLFNDWQSPSLKGLRNPDVTVRSRGVMEKCTYCVQRIEGAKIEAERENRRVRDGEVVPACAQACPSNAITFGDLKDANAVVTKLKAEPRNYSLLPLLNTRPRTTYLARLSNPNPALSKTKAEGDGGQH